MTTTKRGEPTSPLVHRYITLLLAALKKEYGVDYAFVVMGRGRVIAASTKLHGVVLSTAKETDTALLKAGDTCPRARCGGVLEDIGDDAMGRRYLSCQRCGGEWLVDPQ